MIGCWNFMRMQLSTLSAVLLFASTAVAIETKSPFDCSNISVDGYHYDLSFLNKEWTVDGRTPLRFNPCAPIVYNNEACPKGKSYMCAMDPTSPAIGRANIGVPVKTFHNPKNELIMLYSDGGFDMNGFPFISLVRFECDVDSKETGPIEPVSDGSKYFLIWKTRAACPKSAPSPIGSSILGWLVAGPLVYFGLGIAFNFVVRGLRGTDVIPHYAFLADCFDFITEFMKNLYSRLCGSGGYQQI